MIGYRYGSVVAAIALAAGCNRTTVSHAPPAAPPAQLRVVQPQRQALPRIIDLPGSVEAYESAPLYVKFPGFIKKVYADIGDRVAGPQFDPSGREIKPGTLLAEISIPELEDEARQKQAMVEQAAAEIEQTARQQEVTAAGVAAAQAQVAEARAGVKRAQAGYERWDLENTRVAKMIRERVIETQTGDETQRQFIFAEAARDEAVARLATSEKAVLKAKAELEKSRADAKTSAAKLRVAETEAARLQSLLSYRFLRAPFSGAVARRRVDAGHFVQPARGGKEEPLFAVVRADIVRVTAMVPEADSVLVRKGTAARVMIQALGPGEFAGQVARTAESLEPGSRTLRVEIDIPNPDGRLRPGQYAQVRLSATMPAAWVLPAAAVVKQADVTVCYLLKDGKAARTTIQTGRSDGTMTEVFKKQRPGVPPTWEDWTGSEEVLTGQTAGLIDGQVVEPKR